MDCPSACSSPVRATTTWACCRPRASSSSCARRSRRGRWRPTGTETMWRDARGNPIGTDSGAALVASERALWRMMSFFEPPVADLDAAAAEDPGWLLPPVMKAGFLLTLTEPALVPEAAALLDTCEPLAARAPERERVHLAATRAVL